MKVLNEIEKSQASLDSEGNKIEEDIDFEQLKCDTGACPI
jgi:hypothetical protein